MNFAALKALNNNQSLNQCIMFCFCYLHIPINSFFIVLRQPTIATTINSTRKVVLQRKIFVLQKKDKLIILCTIQWWI